MKNCMWLKPKWVAQIEFTEWTPDGHLRHSKFVGLREDKDHARLYGRIQNLWQV
jgi:ATP-dependent DNA ligase